LKVKEPESHRKYNASIAKSLDDIRARGFCASTGELRREVFAVGVPMRRTSTARSSPSTASCRRSW